MQNGEEITIDEEKYIKALDETRSGRLYDAIGTWKEVIADEPRCALAHFNLGQLYDKLNMFAEAMDRYEAACRFEPGKADHHANLGGVYLKMGMVKDAMRELKDALGKDPYNYLIDFNLAGVYLAMSDHDNALLHADKAVDLYSVPGTSESGLGQGVDREVLAKLLARQAECHAERGETDKARQCADRIRKQCRVEVPAKLQAMLDKAPPDEDAGDSSGDSSGAEKKMETEK
jgi:tetratricopeptide (TPR) repeat protein